MEDPEVVAAIVAGDPAGLAEAYDRYALPLYSYCRSLLREPADAADAVQDTFLVATAKLRDLRDPARLRPWLYAVARNECLRRLRAGSALSALEEAGDIPVQSAELGAEAERAEVQQLVRAAIDGLNPGERDVIELSLISELDNDELADALGVSRNHAHALLSRARSQLERSLGALIVARTGRAACAGLDAMLAGWDGQLTALMRKRISRHIEQCEVCGERKRRELTPALFAGAVPIAALLPGFRERVLKVLADRSPAGLTHRLTVANRAGPFGPQGFPKPVSPPEQLLWVGGSVRRSAERAARLRLPFFTMSTDPVLGDIYREECERVGYSTGFFLAPTGPLFVHVTDDPERDWATIAPYDVYDVVSYNSWQTGDHDNVAASSATTAEDLAASGMWQVVTPDECVDLVHRYGTVALHPLMGAMPTELGWRSLQLFADAVAPRI